MSGYYSDSYDSEKEEGKNRCNICDKRFHYDNMVGEHQYCKICQEEYMMDNGLEAYYVNSDRYYGRYGVCNNCKGTYKCDTGCYENRIRFLDKNGKCPLCDSDPNGEHSFWFTRPDGTHFFCDNCDMVKERTEDYNEKNKKNYCEECKEKMKEELTNTLQEQGISEIVLDYESNIKLYTCCKCYNSVDEEIKFEENYYCEKCMKDNGIHKCHGCDEYDKYHEKINGNYYCNNHCMKTYDISKCRVCDDYVLYYERINGYTYCKDCIIACDIRKCHKCDKYVDYYETFNGNDYCQPCKKRLSTYNDRPARFR